MTDEKEVLNLKIEYLQSTDNEIASKKDEH